MLLWVVGSWEPERRVDWGVGWRCLVFVMLGGVFGGVVLRLVYGWSVVRGVCHGIKHRGGLMSGVCGLDDDTEINLRRYFPLHLTYYSLKWGDVQLLTSATGYLSLSIFGLDSLYDLDVEFEYRW